QKGVKENMIRFRRSFLVLVAAASLPAASMAQTVVRVAPAIAPVAGISGTIAAPMIAPSLSAPSALSAAPLAGAPSLSAPALSAAPLAAALPASAVSAAAVPAAAVPAAAAPTAAAALKSFGAQSAAMSAPDASAADAGALSRGMFDSAPALPSSRLSAAIGGPDDIDPPVGDSIDGPRNFQPSDGDVRAVTNMFDHFLRENSEPGQLYSEDNLVVEAAMVGQKGAHAKKMFKLLVKDARFMALSGSRYVYSDLEERFDGDFPDSEVNRAGKLAKQGVRLVNGTGLSDHAQGVTALGDAYEI